MTKVPTPWGRADVHTTSYETVFKILTRILHGSTKMTTIERTSPTITHSSMIYHLDRLLRADLVTADRRRNLSLTERGMKCLKAFQDIETFLKFDAATTPPYKPITILTRAHFDWYDDGIMQWKPPRRRRKS